MRSNGRAGAGIPGVLLGALIATGLTACGGGGGGGSSSNPFAVGTEVPKPGGGTFFVDPNNRGKASRFRIAEIFWGRLVDVHDVDAGGNVSQTPVFPDLTINENVQTDTSNYFLETNPITQKTRLVIRRTKGAPDTGSGTFSDLLQAALVGLPAIIPKNDDGSSPGPFSFITRNSTLVLRFDDLLDDSAEAEIDLSETVKVVVGYPPASPFAPRIIFDPNFGDLVNGSFHSTRLLIDMTISEAESADMPVAQPINSLGLPASLQTSNQPNVTLRIPARIDFGSGQFEVLENLAGNPMATTQNGPIDSSSPTEDIVRAMRSGNPEDLNNGFLLDLNAPEIVGGWPLFIDAAQDDPTGEQGFDFIVTLRFTTQCLKAPEIADILSTSSRFLEVTQPAPPPDGSGVVTGVQVRVLTEEPLAPSSIVGTGLFRSALDPALPVADGCWLSFTPQPTTPPATGVDKTAFVVASFSEPMDPLSVTPFDTFRLIRGDSSTLPVPTNIVVGRVNPTSELKEFTFEPLLNLSHGVATADPYHVLLDGPTDLAGNPLKNQLLPVDFTLEAFQPAELNGGIVMDFSTPDQLEPIGSADFRGQFFFDLEGGLIRPRPAQFLSAPVDRINPVPSIMIALQRPIQTPLSPLGSKMQAVWRYVDLGWQVLDETKHNVDVVGINWAPFGGLVVSDFYDQFEIRLSHSRRQPDEDVNATFLVPKHGNSGLLGAPSAFTANILPDPNSPQTVVHPRSLGYTITPADLFTSTVGTPLMPFPLNRGGGPLTTYTWRDTAALALGAPNAVGVPLDIEVGPPLFLENGPPGRVAPVGLVPTFGLPLLMEFRCYPTDSGLGFNGFDISIAVNSSAQPNFRAFSTGGLDTTNTPITKNPDSEVVPSGGFNPGSTPPGKVTKFTADNALYIGQLDIVIKVSRLHTIWLDSLLLAPQYLTPVTNPGAVDQPAGTQVVLDFRGAVDVGGTSEPFDADTMDPYGDIKGLMIDFLDNDATWKSNIQSVNSARYFQIRVSFINNIQNLLNAELSAIGVAFQE